MRLEDLREYAGRDWTAVAELDAAFWRERKARLGVGEALRVADEMRRAVQRARPDWPSAEERATDLAVHVRVSEALRRVGTIRPR